jgi:hypothetical protein
MTADALMRDIDYPALFRAADAASRSGQARFLCLFKADLVLLVMGALLTAVAVADIDHLRLLRGAAAVAFASSVLLTVIMRQRNDEEAWYGGRAAAESVKTRTWLYMMAADPFPGSLSPQEADRQFADDLASILRQQEQLGLALRPGQSDQRVQITDAMRSLREADLPEKRRTYGTDRVEHQCKWYSKNARDNHIAELRYYLLAIASQAAALITATIMTVWPATPLNYTAVFATLAAAFMSWTQVKKHNELAQIYEITSNELGLVADQLMHVKTHDELSGFVKDAESAISREHTLWVARRSFRLGRL